jgi:hypothetical protein
VGAVGSGGTDRPTTPLEALPGKAFRVDAHGMRTCVGRPGYPDRDASGGQPGRTDLGWLPAALQRHRGVVPARAPRFRPGDTCKCRKQSPHRRSWPARPWLGGPGSTSPRQGKGDNAKNGPRSQSEQPLVPHRPAGSCGAGPSGGHGRMRLHQIASDAEPAGSAPQDHPLSSKQFSER